MSAPRQDAITVEGELYASPRESLEYLDVAPPAPGSAVEVGPNLHWARIPLPMELTHINVWLQRDADGWLLVDTGLSSDEGRQAWLSLEGSLLQGLPLRRIFVTHDHPDHMGLAHWLHEGHGAEVWMSEVGHVSTGEFLATPAPVAAERRFGFVEAHGLEVAAEEREGAARVDPARWYGALPPLSRAVSDGEIVRAGSRAWDVVETSGHCRGHLCLHDAANDVLISGDQVLPTISPNVSVLASRPEANPLREFLDSLEKLRSRVPADTLVLPSHGRPFRGLHRRIEALRQHHLQQLESLREACLEPRSAAELLPVMYGRPLRGFHRFLGLGETIAHLHYLRDEGAVMRTVDAEGRIRFARK